MFDAGEDFKLVDVREFAEYEICKIEGSALAPLSDIRERRLEKLSGTQFDDNIITHCHHGKRSLDAAKILKEMGFQNVKSMKGGIEEWSLQIDSSVPRY